MLAWFNKLVAWFNKRLGSTSRTSASAEEVLARALALIKHGEFSRAVDEFSEAIRLSPAFAQAYNGRAAAYNALMEYEAAYADATKAICLDPAYVTPYVTRAYTLQRRGQFDQAIADYTEALRLEPCEPSLAPRVYLNRAVVYLLKNEKDNAFVDLSHASHLDPRISMPPPGLNCVELLLGSGNSELLLHHDVLAQIKLVANTQAQNEPDEAKLREWELIRVEPPQPCEQPVGPHTEAEWHRQRWHLRSRATTLICEVNLGRTPEGTHIHIPLRT